MTTTPAPRHDLLARIDAFDIDGPTPPALPFAARLAREHGWSRPHAARVVAEYKRFAYLAVASGRPVCPSEAVDAAWHLHLTYTRSYWHSFCRDTLGQPLHHDPTRGGPAEAGKHHAMYDATLAAYQETFGHAPPADIWPPAAVRFGDDATRRTVNVARNWVVPKAAVRRASAALGTAAAALLFATGCGEAGLNPFELNGTEYLAFLIPAMLAAFFLGLVVRQVVNGPGATPGDEPPALDWERAAVLAGGAPRLATAALARLVGLGAARVSDDGKKVEVAGRPPAHMTGAENAVFGALPLDRTDPVKFRQVVKSIEHHAAAHEEALREIALLPTPEQARFAARAGAVPLAVVWFGFGVTRLVVGVMNGKPIGFLLTTLAVSFLVVLGLAFSRPRRTKKGDAAVEQLLSRHTDLKQTPAGGSLSNPALAVALFGTAALAGTEYTALKTWYPKQTSDASSGCGASGCSSGSGGGDGGGGCGSGCGGCGGGGD